MMIFVKLPSTLRDPERFIHLMKTHEKFNDKLIRSSAERCEKMSLGVCDGLHEKGFPEGRSIYRFQVGKALRCINESKIKLNVVRVGKPRSVR